MILFYAADAAVSDDVVLDALLVALDAGLVAGPVDAPFESGPALGLRWWDRKTMTPTEDFELGRLAPRLQSPPASAAVA